MKWLGKLMGPVFLFESRRILVFRTQQSHLILFTEDLTAAAPAKNHGTLQRYSVMLNWRVRGFEGAGSMVVRFP